ncbi:uncharacterized protein LOC118753758, partial [Rhagoletis pomonella]|uniref:uncharacterized protein LOC118753758 n=1 Tax=Rhagoletis pomonella TaxID=28610 RepID=UPI0017841F3F
MARHVGTVQSNKDINGWKKIITECKSEIKRKLAHNKMESRTTGGEPFSKYQLTQTEETIVRLYGIAQTVEGITGVSLGTHSANAFVSDAVVEADVDMDMPSTSEKRKTENANNCSTPKRQKSESLSDRLKRFLDDDNNGKTETNEKLDELINIQKENASSLRGICRTIEKSNDSVAKAVTEIKDEF